MRNTEDPQTSVGPLDLVGLEMLTKMDEDRDDSLSTLENMARYLEKSSLVEDCLDVLNVLPTVVSSKEPGADEFVAIVGKTASPKEVFIVNQEILSRLHEAHEGNGEDVQEDVEHVRAAVQIIRVTSLYTSSISRLKLRKRTASETIAPLFEQLKAAVQSASAYASEQDRLEIVERASQLASKTDAWVKGQAGTPEDEVLRCKGILIDLVTAAVETGCAHASRFFLSRKTFVQVYPRLVVRKPGTNQEPDKAESIIPSAITTLTLLGKTNSSVLSSPPTISSLIFLAHSDLSPQESHKALAHLFPCIITCLRSPTGNALDETLSLLLKSISPPENKGTLSTDLVFPLATILSGIASSHPDPSIRHISFRLISSILAASPPPIRLEILKELTSSDSQPPQMHIAAIGLVKDAVLEGLNQAQNSGSGAERPVFASPVLLQVFGPILFKSRLGPELLEGDSDLKVFEEERHELELKRLGEALAAYYVIFQRDKTNKTGIRDKDNVANIEKSLFRPLRKVLKAANPVDFGHDHSDLGTILVSLQISLDRIDDVTKGSTSATAV